MSRPQDPREWDPSTQLSTLTPQSKKVPKTEGILEDEGLKLGPTPV